MKCNNVKYVINFNRRNINFLLYPIVKKTNNNSFEERADLKSCLKVKIKFKITLKAVIEFYVLKMSCNFNTNFIKL